MKTKLLLGSIGAVAILILVSFTNVVGVQSTTSGTVSDSPLFSIRTQKAINQDGKGILTSGYLGKGRNTIFIPTSEDRTMLYQKIIDWISGMDETTFNNFIAMVIHQINSEPKLKNIHSQGIIAVLYQLKNNQPILPNQNIGCDDKANVLLSTSGGIVCFIGEILFQILFTIYFASGLIFASIIQFFKGVDCGHSFMTGCETCPESRVQVNRYLHKLDMI
jgi:hypothetical protein